VHCAGAVAPSTTATKSLTFPDRVADAEAGRSHGTGYVGVTSEPRTNQRAHDRFLRLSYTIARAWAHHQQSTDDTPGRRRRSKRRASSQRSGDATRTKRYACSSSARSRCSTACTTTPSWSSRAWSDSTNNFAEGLVRFDEIITAREHIRRLSGSPHGRTVERRCQTSRRLARPVRACSRRPA
jgi:hypothetical protein